MAQINIIEEVIERKKKIFSPSPKEQQNHIVLT